MKVYLALSITGRGYTEVVDDIFAKKEKLENMGYDSIDLEEDIVVIDPNIIIIKNIEKLEI